MIKIQYTQKSHTEKSHYYYVKNRIENNWKKMKKKAGEGDGQMSKEIQVLTKLRQALKISSDQEKKIIRQIAISPNLRKLIKTQNRWFRLAGPDVNFLSKALTDLLDYDNFYTGLNIKVSGQTWSWNRHCLMTASNTRVCPYCGRQYITTWEGKTTSSCDHYYPKSSYPLLCINMYNLVPCCHVCNSVMKGKPESDTKSLHLNPYIDPSDCLKFKVKTETVGSIFNISEEVTEIEIIEENIKDEAQRLRAEMSRKIFHLKEVYQYHKREAFELRRALREEENEKYQEIFQNNFAGLSAIHSYAFLYRGREMTEEPLVKFKKDIEEQFRG